MKNDEFFNYLRPWSERKHRLLGKYLKPFSAKVATITTNREIFCVDCFAGAAKYEDGKDGSPLMLAHLSDECLRWQDPVKFKIINIEPDYNNFASLEHFTKNWTQKGVVRNINKKFNDSVPEILATIGNAPALFFIDPFGPTAVHFSHLLPILRRSQSATELIINFDTDGLQRIADASQTKSDNPKTVKAIPTNIQNVSSIIGRTDWLEKYQTQNLSTQEKQNFLLSLYIENLSRFGYSVVSYPIRESLGKPTKYHLIYCTRHNDGIFLMNDFIFDEENSMLSDHFENKLPLFSDSFSDENENRRKKLYVLIEYFLKSNPKTTRGHIKHNLIFEHFAQFHSKDYTAVVKEFIDSERLRASHGKKRINDKELLTYFG